MIQKIKLKKIKQDKEKVKNLGGLFIVGTESTRVEE